MKYKDIIFETLYIYDKANNYSYYNNDSFVIENITINDKNGKIDNSAPIFNSILMSKEKVKVGETIDIIADVSDDYSGIESVVVNYSKYKGDYNYINLNYDSSIKKYKGTLTAEEDVLYKAYYINSIEIKDNAGNYKKKLFNNPYKIYVTDETNKIDIDLPVIKSISVDKNKADIGDKVKISLEASDTTSGIKKAVYTYYMNYEYHSIELNYNTLTKKYEGEIVVEESMKGKILQPSNLSEVDNVGNYTNKSYWDLKELIIKVDYEESIEDLEGAKFLGITLDKKIAKPEEKVKVSVTASDDISGINRISCYFNGMALDLEYNKVTKKYEGDIEILEYDLYKKVFLYNINLVDNKYNYTYIDSYTFGDISFTVADSEGKLDTTKPVLTGYSIYKNIFKWNEKPVIKVNYKDDLSGVETIKIKARNVDGSKVYYGDSYIYERNEGTAYISLYQLSNVLVNERILVEEITLIDFSGNEATYTSDENDFSKLTFDKGNVLKEEKVNIKTNSIYVDEKYVTGTTSIGNVGLRVYNIYNDKIQIIQVGSSDSNGKFNLKLDPNYSDEEYMIEAYNTKTNEVLGYSNIKVNKSADVIKDGTVDIKDLAEVALHYGKQVQIFGGKSTITFEEDTIYNSDINSDYYIDIFDLILVSKKIN